LSTISRDSTLASEAALSVLRKGGNAIDAAVAVAFALAVVHPEACNLGGGGYMVVRLSNGTVRAIDYKEAAPAAGHAGMFVNRLDSTVGYKASAVPGTVAGMALAHSRFGKLPWSTVLEPARRLARDGFPASQRMEIRLPEADLAQARRIAERKGIGYQTLLKMLVREGLVREARRG